MNNKNKRYIFNTLLVVLLDIISQLLNFNIIYAMFIAITFFIIGAIEMAMDNTSNNND